MTSTGVDGFAPAGLKIRHDCAPRGMGLQLASEGPQTRLERDGPAPGLSQIYQVYQTLNRAPSRLAASGC